MKFSKFLTLKEADQAHEIEAIFQKATTDINHLFMQLYSGTAEMVRNYKKAGLPEELKNQLLRDLSSLAKKIKGETKSENVTINTLIKNISENIQLAEREDADIRQGLGSHGVGVGGKPAYDFRTAITNIYRQVVDRMSQLKDAVFRHFGLLKDTHSKVVGLRNTAGNIRNKVDALGQGVEGIGKGVETIGKGVKGLANQPQPFTGDEEDKAVDSLIALSSAVEAGFKIKLIGPEGEIAIKPSSTQWRNKVISLGNKNKIFEILPPDGGQPIKVNIGNPAQVNSILSKIGYSGASDFVPATKRKQRALGVRGMDGKVEK